MISTGCVLGEIRQLVVSGIVEDASAYPQGLQSLLLPHNPDGTQNRVKREGEGVRARARATLTASRLISH